MPLTDAVVSIDLGGTKCAGALINRKGELNFHQLVRYGNASGEAVGSLIVDLAREILARAKSIGAEVTGIGVSAPGIVNVQQGTVWAPNIQGWEDFPLARVIGDGFGTENISVVMESDRGCCMLGERWMGAARGISNAVFLSVGTGIGAGILVDDEIVRGLNDIAGAIGWMALQRPFQNKFEPFGCFEYHASGDGLVRAARELMKEGPTSLIHPDNIDGLTSEDLFAAYEKEDPLAVKVFEQAIELWGMASANLVSLFNPELVIFGGGVFGPGVRFLDQIHREAGRWAQPIAMRQVRFLASQLGGKAQLYGAAYQHFRNSGRAIQ